MNDQLPQREWGTLRMLARRRGVTERTARNWASAGHLKLYRVAGVKGVVVDVNEADAALDRLEKQGKIRPGYGKFAGQPVTVVAEVVDR
jgi:hypothetical protein